MNLVGELVLARNEINQFSATQTHSALLGTSQRLNAITTLLQEGVMQTRLQPIDTAWSKLPRVVRDCAQQCGKRVRLEMEGKDTELDRTLIEAIQDPLTHAIRNCIDHGLEGPADRIAAGKAIEGGISLRAPHEGGQVTIEVSDDGAGIDVDAIKKKAIERSLASPEQVRGMSDQEAIHLIFLPGFSTARIPLTLAIMTALVVSSGRECYAIPQANVLELVRPDVDDARGRVEMIGDAAVYRLRGELLPLVWLNTELTTERRSPGASLDGEVQTMIVLQADDRRFGLVVDAVIDTQEIVVKPLGRHVRAIPIFAGATITGNGRVVLILDIPGVAMQAHVLSVRDRGVVAAAPVEETLQSKESLLLFAGPGAARMAVPMSQITRLEEFPLSAIERLGDRDVVQYFGDLLPLVDIAGFLSGASHGSAWRADADILQTLVVSRSGRQVGVVVERILDTVEHTFEDPSAATGEGLARSLVIDGLVTEVLDLNGI